MTLIEPERHDFWRVRSATSLTVPFKEWQHFIVQAAELDVLVNFSIAGPPGLADDAVRTARVIVLARAARWTGFVETTRRLEVSRDGYQARFDRHRVEIRNHGYRIVIDDPAREVFIDAMFRPQTAPITARRQAIAPGRHLDWSLTARLEVDGHLELAGQVFEVSGALGYHDHNWGHFLWGDDFTWEWGSVLPRDGGDWAVVYSSLLNRARTQLQLEQLFVWRRGVNVMAAGGLDVQSRVRGCHRSNPALRIPPPMMLLASGDSDLPRRFAITARNGDEEITLRFTPESTSQVLIPSERSPRRVLAINECVGRVDLLGWLAGEAVEWEGWGVFEFVR